MQQSDEQQQLVKWEYQWPHDPMWMTPEQHAAVTDRLIRFRVLAPLDAPASDPRIRAMDMMPNADSVITEEQAQASLGAAAGTPVFEGEAEGKDMAEVGTFLSVGTFHRGFSITLE
jgi:hypothetical protein